jgi:Ca2+-binding EF-hand superfamily protein
MKKQFLSIAIIALLAGFTGCKSSSTTEKTTTTKTEQEGKRGQQQGKGERPDAAQIFAEMDTDKDGKISKDEAKGPLEEQFSKIDADQDNYISKEELENAPRPKRGEKPQGGRN